MSKPYKVRGDLPLPPRGSKYPFHRLGVGEMFALPVDCVKAVRAAAMRYARRNPGTAFAVRPLQNAVGFGCWRVK